MHARFGFGGINALYGGMELTDSVRRNDVTRKSTYCQLGARCREFALLCARLIVSHRAFLYGGFGGLLLQMILIPSRGYRSENQIESANKVLQQEFLFNRINYRV